jgi:hypothetical protein
MKHKLLFKDAEEVLTYIKDSLRRKEFVRLNEHNKKVMEELFVNIEFPSKKEFRRKWLSLGLRKMTLNEKLDFYGYNENEKSAFLEEYLKKKRETCRKSAKEGKIVSHFQVSYWIARGFSAEEAKKRVAEVQSKNSLKVKRDKEYYERRKEKNPSFLEYWTLKGFSEEEAEEKRVQYFRRLSKRCYEYWILKGFSEEEAKSKVIEHQSKNAKHYVLNTSAEERRKKNHFCREYWVERGFTDKEIDTILRENGLTFSLELCIEKFGEDEGRKIFKDRQIKWLSTLNEKSEEELKEINRRKYVSVDFNEPGILYLIDIGNGTCKIGISYKDSIFKRYPYEKVKNKQHCVWKIDKLSDAFDIELRLKRRFSEHIVKDDYGCFGWTECINTIGFTKLKEIIHEIYSSK